MEILAIASVCFACVAAAILFAKPKTDEIAGDLEHRIKYPPQKYIDAEYRVIK